VPAAGSPWIDSRRAGFGYGVLGLHHMGGGGGVNPSIAAAVDFRNQWAKAGPMAAHALGQQGLDCIGAMCLMHGTFEVVSTRTATSLRLEEPSSSAVGASTVITATQLGREPYPANTGRMATNPLPTGAVRDSQLACASGRRLAALWQLLPTTFMRASHPADDLLNEVFADELAYVGEDRPGAFRARTSGRRN